MTESSRYASILLMSTFSSLPEPTLRDDSKAEPEAPTAGRFASVRFWVYLVGIVGVVAVCIVVAFSELVASRGGSIDAILLGATHMPPAAIGVLIVLLSANALARKMSKHLRLNSAELAVIYFMLVCAALLSSFGLVGQLLPSLVGINYYANPQDHVWRDMFYPHISKWLVPWDPSGPEQQLVSVRFYEGLRAGESVPWANWVVPIIAWLIFAFLLFFLMACVATLFRKQWVDNEKLTFPLVQLPMEMINEQTSAPFFRNKAMWCGFALPAIIYGLNGLHSNFPNVPGIPSSFALNALFIHRPLNEMIFTPLVLSFSIIGFSYLLPLDVTFSMWFFLLFFRLQDLIALYLGHHLDPAPLYGASRYYQSYQSAGAFVAIVISMLWLARPHLRMIKERVFGNPKTEIDRNEYMSYRFAFWGGVFAFLLMLVWLRAAGMSPMVAFFLISTFVFIIMLVLTRYVSEVGLLMLQPVFRPLDLWAVAVPKGALGAQNLTVASFLNGIFMRDPRNVMPVFMDSMKGADSVLARRRAMAVGAVVAVGIGAFVAVMFQLWVVYTRGGLNLNSWLYHVNPRLYFSEAETVLKGTVPFDYRAPVWFSVGTVFTFFLYAMRSRFWWWPFHPLGYAIGCAWPAVVYWSSFFVGWIVKSNILRYGGAITYRRFRPFFLGLILGEFAMGILWALLTYFIKGIISPSVPIS